jgi:spermidine synthase
MDSLASKPTPKKPRSAAVAASRPRSTAAKSEPTKSRRIRATKPKQLTGPVHGGAQLEGVAARSTDWIDGWHVEPLYKEWSQAFRLDAILYEDKSGDQSVRLIRNERFGKVLFLDGILQTTEADEYIYHEMLAHVPILAHGAAKSVLIIGGGDGGMAREVLRHQSVEKLTMVEIDQRVIDFCKKHLPGLSNGAFDDPRMNLIVGDGIAYMDKGKGTFDIIIVDRSDPIGPARGLYTDSFYRNCYKRIKKNGILVTQNGVPFVQSDELSDTCVALRKIFKDVSAYIATVPTYIGGPMAFGWATDDPKKRTLQTKVIKKRYEAADIETKYYTPKTHKASFALPGYIAKLVNTA